MWGAPFFHLTPALLQVVLKIPFRYGISSHERENSWVFCRVNAWASQAAFAGSAGRLVRVADPVCGFIEPTSTEKDSAQLIAWDLCDPAVWKMAAPASVPSYFEINPNALFRLPQLGAENFLYVRFPKTNYAFLAAPTPVFSGFRPEVKGVDPALAAALAVAPKAVDRSRSLTRNNPDRPKMPARAVSSEHALPDSAWSRATNAAIMVEIILSGSNKYFLISFKKFFPDIQMGLGGKGLSL